MLKGNLLKAILFDLDGTIVNTDPIHYQAWREMLKSHGMEINEKFYQTRISGKTNQKILEEIMPQLSLEAAEKFADDKEAMFRNLAINLQPLPGFRELIDWTEKHNIKRALVTNAPRLNAEFVLKVLGIEDIFPTIVLAEEEIAAKPDPLPYQIGLKRLGVNASEAIALEDSPSGILSAVGADIPTIGIASTHNPARLKDVGAFMVIPDFTDLKFWGMINSLGELLMVNG
jgi:beta-phosphoglucomutase